MRFICNFQTVSEGNKIIMLVAKPKKNLIPGNRFSFLLALKMTFVESNSDKKSESD